MVAIKKLITRCSVLAVALVSLSSYAITEASDVKQFKLKNGMQIMVLEDHSIPNANMYIFWKVGSRNEYPGITGLSHFFEHMMFNGAKKYGPKMFDRTMEAAGGSNNAYTTENLTVYTNWFPADSMETMFDLEADRIQHLAIEKSMVESERGVVSSERTTGLENSNFRSIWQEVKGAAFRAHPYSWPVIGHASDIENWSLEDLKEYHKTYYAPNNAVVVIAGDVTVEKVKALAKKYFEPIPAQAEPREVHTVEPEQKGERRVYAHKASVTTPNIMIGYHVPNTQHKDYYALNMLSEILSSGNSSRLHKSLVSDQQLASSVFTYFPESIDPNLFYIYAVAAKDVPAEKLEKAIIAEVNSIVKNGVTAKELEKVKNRKLVDFYRTMSTINGKANTIGTYELFFGDYTKLFSAPEDFNKVTPEDIKQVASKYLRKANRTVGILSSQEDTHEEDL
ncbi:M16 family metallopeptidase [Flocculibacter collagenilyticus]|uniref:M16 family metallopeptidase n=1 Tax=Flocculibacter collagenilyticus TaxID=2744479 RepID=UPI0018F44222|nr:pitrilysin family protein [Flocculibacter collagenilyticus]